MKPTKISLAPLLALIFAGYVHLHSVDIHPGRVTGIVGGEVQINCEVEFGPNLEMSWDVDGKFVYIITNEKENYPLGTSKYSVQITGMNYTLSVRDLNLEDGGEYMCTSFTSEATAILVVLDTPSITLNPPTPIEGETAMASCEAIFGGPKKNSITPGHFPKLNMYLKGSSLNEMIIEKETEDVQKNYFYIISLIKNLTVHASMNTRHITCEIGTAEPFVKTSGAALLNVLYSVREIHITPNQEKYEVGDNISCIADSNPAAYYEWKKIQGGTIYGKWLNITETMIGENSWECVARNMINGKWFEEIKQWNFVADISAVTIAVDPSKSGNDRSPVTIAVVTVVFIILVIIAAAAFIFRKILMKQRLEISITHGNPQIQHEQGDAEAPKPSKDKKSQLGLSGCIQFLRSVRDKDQLDQHGKEILIVLKENETAILENDPTILSVLIKKAVELIDSEYYKDIIKVVSKKSQDSPLKCLLLVMKDESKCGKLFKNQNKLLAFIKKIAKYGEVQFRSECLAYLIIGIPFSNKIKYRFEWSEELLYTLKYLLEHGADPTWIPPTPLKQKEHFICTAQTEFFSEIFYINLIELSNLVIQVLPLMMPKKCNNTEVLTETILHASLCWSIHERWSLNLCHQLKFILKEILRHDETLVVQKDHHKRMPLHLFLMDIKLNESIISVVREIIQLLQSPEVLASYDEDGQNALHYLVGAFPVIQGQVKQRGRESFLELVKSFSSETNVGCQDKLGQTALHWLALKFPGGIPEESREVYQDFVKHLSTYDILEIKDKNGRTALHLLAYYFTFEIEDWKMETFVEVLKCLAVPRTICIKDEDGLTALEIINKKWGNKVPEHYKDNFQEISDILSVNN